MHRYESKVINYVQHRFRCGKCNNVWYSDDREWRANWEIQCPECLTFDKAEEVDA